jgi:quercetin dioxygenase-like cupin family protein
MKAYVKNVSAIWASIFFVFTTPHSAQAHDSDTHPKVKRQILTIDSLPGIDAHIVKSLTIELAANVRVGEHMHEGFIYAYLLQGSIRSQLDNGEIIEYAEGDSWVEPPLSRHTLTENTSDTEPAKLLIVFIGKEDARLTVPKSDYSGVIDTKPNLN